LAARLQIKIFF